jgi:hypothetical protein
MADSLLLAYVSFANSEIFENMTSVPDFPPHHLEFSFAFFF